MGSYHVTPRAAQDLDEIHDFIAEDSPKAALRLMTLLEAKCETLSQSPEIGRRRHELAQDLRSFPVGDYVIFYKPVKNGIQVVRVLHAARDIVSIFTF